LNARRKNKNNPYGSNPEEKSISDHKKWLDETTLLHIQTATSLIEGRSVTMDEVFIILTKIMRQLSIDKRKRFTYDDSQHGKIPP